MGRNKCKLRKGHFPLSPDLPVPQLAAQGSNLANAFYLRRNLSFVSVTCLSGAPAPHVAGVWSGGSLQTLFTKATPALPSSSAAPWRNYLGEKEAGFKLL